MYVNDGNVTMVTLDDLVTFNDFHPFLNTLFGQASTVDLVCGDFNGDGWSTSNPDLQGFLNALAGGGFAPFPAFVPEPDSLFFVLNWRPISGWTAPATRLRTLLPTRPKDG